jgi:hypothetical protein
MTDTTRPPGTVFLSAAARRNRAAEKYGIPAQRLDRTLREREQVDLIPLPGYPEPGSPRRKRLSPARVRNLILLGAVLLLVGWFVADPAGFLGWLGHMTRTALPVIVGAWIGLIIVFRRRGPRRR